MADIVISEFIDETALVAFEGRYSVLYDPKLVNAPDQLRAAVRDCKGMIVRNVLQVRGALLDAATRLQVIGRHGVGLDNIDLVACKARGITVCPATGANDVSVAEYVIATTMLLLRRAYRASDALADGSWPREALIGGEVAGKVLGLVGFGNIGRETARRAQALGMNVIAADPFVGVSDPVWQASGVRPLSLPTLLAKADVVSLHLPLTPGTADLIDAEAIALMKPGAVLINTARGGIVDEAALVAALRAGALGGAALDVFASEPLTTAAGAAFKDVPNLLLTPHIAGLTREANARVAAVTVANVLRVLDARAQAG